MRRYAAGVLFVAGCTAPRSLPAGVPTGGHGPAPAANNDSGPTDGSGLVTVPVEPDRGVPVPAGVGPDAGTISVPHDAAREIWLPVIDALAAPAPDAGPDLKPDKPDRPPTPDMHPPAPDAQPPEPQQPPAPACVTCGTDCWPPLVCVVVSSPEELGRVPLAPFCLVAKGGTTVNGTGQWEVAGADGTCAGFFGRFHALACMRSRPGLRYEEHQRRYDLRGEPASDDVEARVLACP